ncbi:VPLPA-CTERM sorting domain-containing protein [Tateyamaria armeniaca]|uniref:VPLPA-CTERM sorting domain-containing protein n=1 Tax=Tateyamaria armeniaca TaxID=2518930 RepID=A0ABW8UWE3_9RHOB
MSILKTLGLSIVISGVASLASAATFYSDLASFQAATTTTVESFEDPYALQPSFTFADFTISETNGAVNQIGAGTPPFSSTGVVSGTGNALYEDNGASLLNFNGFSSAFTAFGLWMTSTVATTVTVSGSAASTFDLVANTPQFFGVTDIGGLSSVIFSASGSPSLVIVDDVYTGTVSAIPLPAGGILLLAGLGGLAALRRRKKS